MISLSGSQAVPLLFIIMIADLIQNIDYKNQKLLYEGIKIGFPHITERNYACKRSQSLILICKCKSVLVFPTHLRFGSVLQSGTALQAFESRKISPSGIWSRPHRDWYGLNVLLSTYCGGIQAGIKLISSHRATVSDSTRRKPYDTDNDSAVGPRVCIKEAQKKK